MNLTIQDFYMMIGQLYVENRALQAELEPRLAKEAKKAAKTKPKGGELTAND